MKKITILIILWVACCSISEAKKLKAVFAYASFSTPNNENYLETYLSVDGTSVKYVKNANKKFQGSIQITIVCKQDDKIIAVDKYNLLTPEMLDTSKTDFSFLDQKRISLTNGDYILEIIIKDNNAPENESNVSQKVHIDFPSNKISMSDISLIESYTKNEKPGEMTKNGFDMVPMVDNFYFTNLDKLIFYNEIYNTQKLAPNESFLLTYYLEDAQSLQKIEAFTQFKKQKAQNVIVTLGEFQIGELASGNYNLVVELRNKMNELLIQKKTFIQRSNKNSKADLNTLNGINTSNTFVSHYTLDQLAENIRCLTPISSADELNYAKILLANKNQIQMQQYLIYFWQKRDSGNPQAAWEKYEGEVRKVNEAYSSKFTKGYDTDRGIIYLRYGPPNNIRKNDFDSQTYPYEIWHYYKIKNFTNKRFVFYSPDNIANELVLLHSDVPGERNDPQWKYKILARTLKNADNDKDPNNSYYGDKLEIDFNE